jgi:uncharacterized protein (DUF952 family)
MKTILHITTKDDWDRAKRKGTYEAPSLSSEGFIHCSTPRQIVATANRYYRGATDLLLLVIDESSVSAKLKYEPPAGAQSNQNDLFPHVYGPISLDAVVEIIDFPPGADGTFELPESVT